MLIRNFTVHLIFAPVSTVVPSLSSESTGGKVTDLISKQESANQQIRHESGDCHAEAAVARKGRAFVFVAADCIRARGFFAARDGAFAYCLCKADCLRGNLFPLPSTHFIWAAVLPSFLPIHTQQALRMRMSISARKDISSPELFFRLLLSCIHRMR